jgi:hypothetical protein
LTEIEFQAPHKVNKNNNNNKKTNNKKTIIMDLNLKKGNIDKIFYNNNKFLKKNYHKISNNKIFLI